MIIAWSSSLFTDIIATATSDNIFVNKSGGGVKGSEKLWPEAEILGILIRQNQCHSTGVKKSYFAHTFHLTPKTLPGGWAVKSDFSFSLCPKWTQSLTTKVDVIYYVYVHIMYLLIINEIEKKSRH